MPETTDTPPATTAPQPAGAPTPPSQAQDLIQGPVPAPTVPERLP